jgi:hypothetical protein
MAQAITAFAIFLVVTVGVITFLNRRTRDKMREAAIELEDEKPRLGSKRQQRMVASFDPPKELPTIEELVAQEAADTGVNEIPGGSELDVSLKLRVYWRDEVVRRGCSDGTLEFRVAEGVTPEDAETDDVRLVCVRSGGTTAEPMPVTETAGAKDPAAAADDPDTVED